MTVRRSIFTAKPEDGDVAVAVAKPDHCRISMPAAHHLTSFDIKKHWPITLVREYRSNNTGCTGGVKDTMKLQSERILLL